MTCRSIVKDFVKDFVKFSKWNEESVLPYELRNNFIYMT